MLKVIDSACQQEKSERQAQSVWWPEAGKGSSLKPSNTACVFFIDTRKVVRDTTSLLQFGFHLRAFIRVQSVYICCP